MAEEVTNAELKAVHEAFNELKSELSKKTPDPEKIERIEKSLDDYEAKSQAITTSLAEAKKREDELKERVDTLEVELARKSNGPGGVDYKTTPEYKALEQLMIKGDRDIDAEQKALLRTDIDISGGYLALDEQDTVIIKNITEISPMRQIARVRTMSGRSLEMAKRTALLTAEYEGEAETGTDDASTYGSEKMEAWRLTVTVPVTRDQLNDSRFDMEREIFTDVEEAFAYKEGNKFVLGTGVKQPEGFTTNANLIAAAITSSTSGVVEADDYLRLTGELKQGYNPVFVMNRRTLANLRTKKSTDGVYLWQPGLNGNAAATIGGDPYVIMPDMPDIAANSYSVAYGDFSRGYTIVDRMGMSMVRDEVTRKRDAVVEFTFYRWNNGQVTLSEAIKLLKTAP